MQKQKDVSTLIGIIIIVAVAAVLFGGVFTYQYYTTKSEAQNPKSETNSNVQNSNTKIVDNSLTISQIENAPVENYNNLSECVNPTELTNGSFKFNCAPGTRYHAVGLAWDSLSIHKDNAGKDEIYFADLNGDGKNDAVAVLDFYGGNEFIGQNIGVWLNTNNEPELITTEALVSGEDPIKSVNINNGIITVNFLYLGRENTTVRLKFENGLLKYLK